MRPGRVLIVEDDEGIGGNLQRALASDDIEVQWVRTAAEALAESVDEPPDLMLLDLGLPDADGLDVCQTVLARQPALPIIILTARDAEIDIVVGLDSGAVDYVTKPFRLAELSARVRAHMRRRSERGERFVVGGLVVDLGGRVATLDDADLGLRAKEFDLIAALASVAGSALRREDLMSAIWDEHWYGSTKTLDVTIASLRRKLEAVSPGAVNITTLRGVGYRLERP
jgi:DNA-binding response OmpR family regulator